MTTLLVVWAVGALVAAFLAGAALGEADSDAGTVETMLAVVLWPLTLMAAWGWHREQRGQCDCDDCEREARRG